MASVSRSSTMSSSISEDSHDLSLELQPAPLRLPRRKKEGDFDGSKSMDQEQISTVEDDSSRAAIHQDSIPPLPEPVITKIPSQRRPPAPKLGSLVSKFEILDAVNSTESTSASKFKPSGIPRGQTTAGKIGSASEPSKKIASIVKHSATEDPADVSPKQVVSPPLIGNKSKLPVSTLFKPATEDHSAETVSRLHENIKERVSAEGKERSSKNQGSPTQLSKDEDFSGTLPCDTTFQAIRRPG
ncbi:hypothetical protein F4805DRAFT_476614 [Annulohypoxylon moriforme]|nr:hypothetical protein F4805DRAFT_476614 [Annulohypoxylon moriforme]